MNTGHDDAIQTPTVRVEWLPPMLAVRFHAFGTQPEQDAWNQVLHWTEARGLLQDLAGHPIFGFNNPSPTAPSTEYGYEFWMRVNSAAEAGEGVAKIEFPGGWYAVMTQTGPPGPAAWMRLLDWVHRSPHRYRKDHELERLLNPLAPQTEMVFDLYLPIECGAGEQPASIRIRGADFIMYPVSNLAQAAQFYRETLGLPQETYSEQWQWAEFNCGNITLALKGNERLADRTGAARVALAVGDVRAAHACLKSKGVRSAGEPVDYGVCCAVEIFDPDGNPLILHRRANGTCGAT